MKNTNKCSFSESDKEEMLLEHDIDIQESITESKDKYRRIIQAGITQWVKDFQNGDIQISSVEDLKKLIELDIELQKDDEL